MNKFVCLTCTIIFFLIPNPVLCWDIEVLDNDKGESSSIYLNEQDWVYVAYYPSPNYRILYKEGDQWQEFPAPDSIRGFREFIDMEVDSDGGVHVTFSEGYSIPEVWYDKWGGEFWDITLVDKGYKSSLSLDINGFPFLSYKISGGVASARWDGSSWIIEQVDSLRGWESSIAVNSEGNPCFSYYGTEPGQSYVLKYASRDSSGWHVETVDDSGDRGHMNSLALDSKDNPHIAYIAWFWEVNMDSLEVWYTYKEGNEWQIEVVDEWDGIEPMGYFWDGQISLDLDADDVPHISYRNEDRLYYAKRDPWTGEWSKEMVDTTWGAGRYTSLDIDSNGYPHISYSVWEKGVRYVTNRPTSIGGGKPGSISLPNTFSLAQNYPNPFNPSTTISFDVSGTIGVKQPISLTIYDIRGRRVRTLINLELEPGSHSIVWNGKSDNGVALPSGFYFYTLKAGDETYTRKMTILK